MDEESNSLSKAREAIIRNDPASAFRIWNDLAAEGNATAQHCLGWCFEQGVGCEIDYFECARWWTLAAEKGVTESFYGLGYCYEHGRGVDRSLTAAYCWYVLAMQNAYEGANMDVERIRPLLTPSEYQEAKAFLDTLPK